MRWLALCMSMIAIVAVGGAGAQTDTRLDQKVTYRGPHKSVSVILDELSAATGVAMKAGYDAQDWLTRDRKMNILVKDVPLRDLMDSIARVARFKCSREARDNTFTYTLYMDRGTKLEADTRAQREEQERQKERAEWRARALAAYAAAANSSPEELARLKKSNPYLHLIAETGIASSLSSLLNEAPAVASALAEARTVRLSGGDLSGSAQEHLLAAIQAFWTAAKPLGEPFPDDFASSIGRAAITVNSDIEQGLTPAEATYKVGNIAVRCGEQEADLPILHPESEATKTIGKALARSEKEGRPMAEIAREYEREFLKAAVSAAVSAARKDPGERAPRPPDEPGFHTKLKPSFRRFELVSVMIDLAKQTGLNIVSDSFNPPWEETGFYGEEMEVRALLDKIARAFGCNWDKYGAIVEFRDRKCYQKLAALLPDAKLEPWRKKLKETGTLDIDDLGEIASLSREQITVNIKPDEAMRASMLSIDEPALRFYASLSAAQRDALMTQSGLDLRSLPREQWPAVEKFVSSLNSEYLGNREAKLTLTGVRKQKDERISYVFTLTTSEDRRPLSWFVTAPRYPWRKPSTSQGSAAPAVK